MLIRKVYMITCGLLWASFACNPDIQVVNPSAENTDGDDSKNTSIQEHNRKTIWLETDGANDNPTLNVNYNNAEAVHPRVAEIFLKYDLNLVYKNSVKGKALEQSEKQLVVQEIEPGKIRVVILSSENTNAIESGTLLTVQFEKKNDEKGTVEILTEQPIFAPEEANEGLLVGDPIEI